MLRKIRITLSTILFTLITLLFLDFTGIAHQWFGWIAKIQFIPALLALNVGIVVALIALTLLFGRVYCSVICPLGVFQDAVAWISKRGKKKKYSYSPEKKWLRFAMLTIFIIAFVISAASLFALLEPYSAYGRIASNLFAPVYRGANNLLAWFAERADSYSFYTTDIWIKSIATLGIAILTFVIIGYLAWRNGRTWCNTICPVGTVLGYLSKFSFFKPVINPEKCTRCSLCSKGCKAACIDYKNYEIDHSRCVSCMNCLGKCKFDALYYTTKRPARQTKQQPETTTIQPNTRRNFLSATTLPAATAIAKAQQVQLHVDGGLADIEDKKTRERATKIIPPGASGIANFEKHCTGCQLCVSVCPNQILRPSANLKNLMQPEMSYERGYCRPECTRCSEVCPTGAIKRITKADKSATQIGRAYWIKEDCLAYSEDVTCDNCARHCPVSAIDMIQNENGYSDTPIPLVDTERCIGCGACENLCPARPYSAIYVEGNVRHRIV